MTLETILGLVIQTAALMVAILAVLIPYLSDQRKKQQQALETALNQIREQFKDALAQMQEEMESRERRLEKAIDELKARLDAEHEDRVMKTARIHERVDHMQENMISDLQGRISGMEGEIKGLANILNKIHEWFINQAGKAV